ncbi:hypothetical protein ACUW9N_000818 [Staphylococcus auricularis]|uniref:Gram-positive cocci surface proteins LPxTG domain-containing protein n=2 Tax=Staphylococcus auricularis TaxID=29379 RepID=A0AAP8PQL7_9STAP|nr:LPXTG cell wall anchor domain-containing protein [Staphylococcus auricularis]MBM0868180.1 hypothetical protein [Staphylococcus auricularis]MCG7341700.1 LPXTG cell wall anchor domain-containing protein [Staphylococcus auricularis]PNZ69306.1 hypothetical protein CD158_00890 [Staphylococcus auricularis]QPT06904.1 LPXTG cell wall anchor domain-containing protein [Staphylococcus auricularis]SQJ13581.1 cell wall surface anchor family protein [Staphylococcus auricularis]
MKKFGFAAVTVLTGSLMLTDGFANAQEGPYDVVAEENATAIAQDVASQNEAYDPSQQNFAEPESHGDFYQIETSNKSGIDAGAYRVHDNGVVEFKSGLASDRDENYNKVGQYEFAITPTQNNSTKTKDNKVDRKMEIGQSPQDEKADKKEEALPKTGESDHHAGRNIAATLLLTMGTVLTITKRNTKEVK